MPRLIAPAERLYAAWSEAHEEWGPGLHEDGFGLLPNDDVSSPAGFAAWIGRLSEESEHCTHRWIVEGGQVLGGIALRHHSIDVVQPSGHIGYGIRPSARGRGLATWALGQILDEARTLGMNRVLVVCQAGNAVSAKTIERRGGICEDAPDNAPVWRYWINVLDRACDPLS
ncbi:GNAT family N-acetyltransferase [Arthrobacter monumenti]